MKARFRASKGTKYSYEEHYEDDDDDDDYDDDDYYENDGRDNSRRDRDYGNLYNADYDDDKAALNDCLDQIYEFFNDDVCIGQDTLVEFLRHNNYNVQETIDFVLESGDDKITDKEISSKPGDRSSIPPKSQPSISTYTIPSDTLAASIKQSVPVSGYSSRTAVLDSKPYTIRSDILPPAGVFSFNTPSPDDVARQMQQQGKQRVQQHKNIVEIPPRPVVVSPSELPRPLTPQPVKRSIIPQAELRQTRSKTTTPKSPRSPVEEGEIIESIKTVKSPPALLEGKELLSVIVAGHVDHGKSTIVGHLLYGLNVVNDREMRKIAKEATDRGKQSFNYAFVMDQGEDEREHGVTINVGETNLETSTRCITLFDAPGHRDFIANMISGGIQADCGVLVVSAQKGEFESGYSAGGITKEHLLIMSSSGITNIAIMINKMDTCGWSEERFKEITNAMIPYVKFLGFKKNNVSFIPASGLVGTNLLTNDRSACKWYEGPSLLDFLNTTPKPIPSTELQNSAQCILSVHDIYHEEYRGNCLAVRVLKGFYDMNHKKNMMLIPSKQNCTIRNLFINDKRAVVAGVNTNAVVCVEDSLDLSIIKKGDLIISANTTLEPSNRVVAQIFVNDTTNTPIMKGMTVVVFLSGNVITAVIHHVIALVDATGKIISNKPKIIPTGKWASVELALETSVFVSPFTTIPALGRFIIQDNGLTIGFGKVTEVKKEKRHKHK